jgi:hypothetical protein
MILFFKVGILESEFPVHISEDGASSAVFEHLVRIAFIHEFHELLRQISLDP